MTKIEANGITFETGLKIFYNEYLHCALWCGDFYQADGSTHTVFTFPDALTAEAKEKSLADCTAFFMENYEMVKKDFQRAGQDFWLTRNGHGSSFLDGHWPEEIERVLYEASKKFPETDFYEENGIVGLDY